MNIPVFWYWIPYFCGLNIATDGLGIDIRGHLKSGTYEIKHPLTPPDEVHDLIEYLHKKENQDTKSGNMWKIHLLGFSLMYIEKGW